MVNRDRVSDLYFGKVFGPELQNACRDRVHWMCRSVEGERVLDIGCSQGITPIILGREGHSVVGLDIEEEAISDAREALRAEPAQIQERVEFKVGDAYTAGFEAECFDTVTLGEVLEHLASPEKLLRCVHGWLVPGGRLVITVPYGLSPYHDHKETYYLQRLIDVLSDQFSLLEVEVLHRRYLCAVAEKPRGAEPTRPSAEQISSWLREHERVLKEIQLSEYQRRQTHEEVRKGHKAQLRRADARADALELDIARARAEVERAEVAKKEADRDLKRSERRVERLDFYKAELDLTLKGVRYRVGDAFVRAARPSRDTLKLPFRLLKLILEGRRRQAERDRLEGEGAPAKSASSAVAEPDGDRSVVTPPKSAVHFEGSPVLMPPFSETPIAEVARPDLTIAGVMDEFSWRSWQYEAAMFTFTPQDWQEALEARKPDMLLVESAWKGIDSRWHFQLRDMGKRPDLVEHYAIPDVVKWCRDRDIPTVFYNKEDHPNFEVFIDAAKIFDYVFTSDANCIPDYKKQVGHDRIQALPFAAQPRIHNPEMTGARSGSVCFAGTWYGHRHHSRRADAQHILAPALEFDLDIYDRMAGSTNKNYHWPDEYLGSVRGSLPYAQILAAYKRYKAFLNVNSVTDSPTMFARRVFELLACGTPVISSYSEGIEVQLGGDLVLMSSDEETTRSLLERLMTDEDYRERLSLLGQRRVLSGHTYSHRLDTILSAIGLDRFAGGASRDIDVIAPVEDSSQVGAALANFARQSEASGALILVSTDASVLEGAEARAGEDTRVSLVQASSWGAAFQAALEKVEALQVAVMNPRDLYGSWYLADYANAWSFVSTEAIGKGGHHYADGDSIARQPGPEYRVTTEVQPWSLCALASAVRERAGRYSGAQSSREWWSCLARDFDQLYASDRFNYVRDGSPLAQSEQPDRLAVALA